MNENDFVLLGIFYDKYQFEKVRDILTDAGIEFTASNRAPGVNYRVPGAAFTEIEVHVDEKDIDKAEALLTENGIEE